MNRPTLVDTVFLSTVNLGKTCLQVYDLTTGSCIKSFRGTCVSPKTLCPVGSSDYFLCGQKDKPLLQAWAINQNGCLQMRFPVPGVLNVVAVSQSVDKLCALGVGEQIFIYHLNTGCQFANISRHYQDVTCLRFTSCGNYLASGGEDGFLYLWSRFSLLESLHKSNRPKVEPHYILGQHSDKVTGISICGTGLRGILISCSMDYSAKVFDLVTGHLRHNIVSSCGFTACDVNAIGSQIFLAGDKGSVWGVNLLPHIYTQNIQVESQGTACHQSAIHHLALSSSGDHLVTGGVDGEVKMWSIVVAERKGTFGVPSLALQKTLLAGRGPVTNILVMKLDVDAFNLSSLSSTVVLTPFNNDVDILDANMSLIAPTKENEPPFTPAELCTMAVEVIGEIDKGRKQKKTEIKPFEWNDRTFVDAESIEYVKKLKKSNEELYKLCLKHVIGED